MSLELESRFVKRGLWTNLEHGPILGKTITTDTKTGNLVVALLAVLSTLGTAHLWHLIAFAIHQIRANGRPADALFRQQQALLRSLPTPSTIMIDVLKLWWVWRKKTDRPFLRSIALVLLAFVFATATIAASVFSSLVVDSGTIAVLVDSPLCGSIKLTNEAWSASKIPLDRSVPVYATDCYKNGTLPSSCNVFMRPNLPLKVENASCPFWAKSMCYSKDAVTIDSGLVDVGDVFGLNLPAKYRVRYRRKTTCAVLPAEGFTSIVGANMTERTNISRDYIPGEEMIVLNYDQKTSTRATIVSLLLSNCSSNPILIDTKDFYSNLTNKMGRSFFPITELIDLNGDTTVRVVLSGTSRYGSPIDDPLFSAHQPRLIRDDTLKKDVQVYMADDILKGVGCLQQYQHCYTGKGNDEVCTPLQGQLNFTSDYAFPGANDVQRALLHLLITSNYFRDLGQANTLLANNGFMTNNMRINSLPDDQWKKEVLGWEKEVWAGLQISVSNYAIGPAASTTMRDEDWIRPETEAAKMLCQVQKMKKSGEFVNINVFGFSFVVGFSLLVALLDITLLKFLIFLSRFRRAIAPRIDRWTQDGIWQLQRRAYEGEGHRDWTNLEKEIPLTDNGRKLKDLPILWLPGKSPAALSAETFSSASSINSRPTGLGITTTHGQDGNGTRAKRGFGFLRLWRR